MKAEQTEQTFMRYFKLFVNNCYSESVFKISNEFSQLLLLELNLLMDKIFGH